jgi:hypothetical protein
MALIAFAAVGLLVTTFRHFGGHRLVSHLRPTYDKGQPQILLVSAFFPLAKSKHPMSDYETWLGNFLSHVTTDVYFFCPPDIAPLVRRLRGGLPLTLNTSFSSPFEVPPMRGLEKRYEEMHRWDREKDMHGPELYAVWNAKAYFLDEGMRNMAAQRGRPYDYAFWNDAGSMRNWQYRAWPDSARIAELFTQGALATGSPEDDIIFIPVWNPPGREFETWKEEAGPLDPTESFSEGEKDRTDEWKVNIVNTSTNRLVFRRTAKRSHAIPTIVLHVPLHVVGTEPIRGEGRERDQRHAASLSRALF